MNEKKRLFQVLDEMNVMDTKNGTQLVALCNLFISADKVSQGAKISMGAPESVLFDIIADKVFPLLLLVDKAEYKKKDGGTAMTEKDKMTEKSDAAIEEILSKERNKRPEGVYEVRRNGVYRPEYAHYFPSTDTWMMVGPPDETYIDSNFVEIGPECHGKFTYQKEEPEQTADDRISRIEKKFQDYDHKLTIGIIIGLAISCLIMLFSTLLR